MLLFLIPFTFIKLLATMRKQLYKLFAIVIEAFELHIGKVTVSVKQFQPVEAFLASLRAI